ncbi:hypothetical protein H8356DRAFT_1039909 [Neocallimastix lanati (nom. inval.)]|nr:hypothetical protein H8356DRAFT_1039909 [Neocallimastix sp. JGI-2020a]
MISYEIQFQGELWDIQNSDYQNYFSNKTPFINCSEVELYQYGSATVEVINNEPIIQDFIGEFEFVYQNNSLRFWEIPSGYNNSYINKLITENSSISDDSLLTLSRKSSKMTEENKVNTIIPLLHNFEIVVYSNELEEERRNPFIFDDKQGTPTISYLDVINGAQHEVTPTQDPEWVDIESIGQVNYYLMGLLGTWKGLQFKYEALQELYDNGDIRVKKSQVRTAKRDYLDAKDKFFREQTKEQTKIELQRMNSKILELRKELNNNIALAGTTAVKALEQNEDTRMIIENQTKKENNRLVEFLNEFDTRASQFQNEITSLNQANKKLFDMIRSVAGMAITNKDLQEIATLKNIDEINTKILDYYSKLEETKNTIIALSKESSKEQTNALLTLGGNIERGLNQHQRKFESLLKNLNANYCNSLNSIKDITVKAISDAKLPEKLAITTNLDAKTNKTLAGIMKNISELAAQFTISLQLLQRQMEAFREDQSKQNDNILRSISLCNETINFYKNFTENYDIFPSSKDGQILSKIITNSINDIFARIENIIPTNTTVVPTNINNKEIFNYNLYLDTIIRYPKTAILFEYKTDSNGFISDISIKKKFENYTHNLLNYIFKKYNSSDDLSSLVSMKTADVLNLPYRKFTTPSKMNKGKEPEPIIVPPKPLNTPMASTSSPKMVNPSSFPRNDDLEQITKVNAEFNEADSAKYFPSRALYREYKVIDSNIAEWAKSTAVKLSASNKKVSFQVPYKLSYSDSSSEQAKDPSTFQKIFNIKKPMFSGKVEDADDFVHQFHDYLHHFAHPPNEEYLCTAFLSCLPSAQRNYFYNKFLPARGVSSGRISIPFNEILAHFQTKFATYSIEEAQKLWNNLKLEKNHLDVFETKINKIAKILKISDYAKGLKVYEIMPKKWQEEAIKKNICFSIFSDDNFEPIMRFVNKMALEERVLQDQRIEYLQLSGVRSQNQEVPRNFVNSSRKGSTRRKSKSTKKNQEPQTSKLNEDVKKNTGNKPGYKAYKRRNKYKKNRQISYFNTVDSQEESDSEEESTVQKENTNDIIQQQLQDLLKVNDDQYSTQEIECINEVSHYFIDEMFTPDPKYFINGLELQKAIDKLQVAAPWKITKNAEAYVNPVIISNTEKQPMIRLLMLIDSGGSLNLISKKLVELLKLPSKASYQEFSTISGKAKATKKTLISFCCKLADKIRETNNEEFLNAVPQYSTPIS